MNNDRKQEMVDLYKELVSKGYRHGQILEEFERTFGCSYKGAILYVNNIKRQLDKEQK